MRDCAGRWRACLHRADVTSVGIGAVAMLHWLRKPPEEAPLDARTRWLLFVESFLGNFLFGFLIGLEFVAILTIGFVYMWKKGALDWE